MYENKRRCIFILVAIRTWRDLLFLVCLTKERKKKIKVFDLYAIKIRSFLKIKFVSLVFCN